MTPQEAEIERLFAQPLPPKVLLTVGSTQVRVRVEDQDFATALCLAAIELERRVGLALDDAVHVALIGVDTPKGQTIAVCTKPPYENLSVRRRVRRLVGRDDEHALVAHDAHVIHFFDYLILRADELGLLEPAS